ncbi:hypothetical protein OXB_2585 [Bacillus sp. OxB-1]|nr:hypothetical protein OXB_2585 [Bacillus sp. OxB-1]
MRKAQIQNRCRNGLQCTSDTGIENKIKYMPVPRPEQNNRCKQAETA